MDTSLKPLTEPMSSLSIMVRSLVISDGVDVTHLGRVTNAERWTDVVAPHSQVYSKCVSCGTTQEQWTLSLLYWIYTNCDKQLHGRTHINKSSDAVIEMLQRFIPHNITIYGWVLYWMKEKWCFLPSGNLQGTVLLFHLQVSGPGTGA